MSGYKSGNFFVARLSKCKKFNVVESYNHLKYNCHLYVRARFQCVLYWPNSNELKWTLTKICHQEHLNHQFHHSQFDNVLLCCYYVFHKFPTFENPGLVSSPNFNSVCLQNMRTSSCLVTKHVDVVLLMLYWVAKYIVNQTCVNEQSDLQCLVKRWVLFKLYQTQSHTWSSRIKQCVVNISQWMSERTVTSVCVLFRPVPKSKCLT